MNNSREKFEEALNNCVLETQCMLEYDETTTRDIAHFIWQAARAIDAKRIAELEAKLNADFPLIVKLFERIDELEAQNKAMREVLQAYSENKKIGLAATCVLAALDKEG